MTQTTTNPFVAAFLKDVESVASAVFEELQDTLYTPKDVKEEDVPVAPEEDVDPVKETYRLLKKAEEAASGRDNEPELLIQIADRYSRIIEAALIYQN